MVDTIAIEGLRVLAMIGIYPHEMSSRQPVIVDLRLGVSLAEAGLNEDFSKTVDYEAVANEVRALATERHHKLVETLAESIAARIRELHPNRVQKVWVRVAKPRAVADATTIAIEIER